MSYAVEQIEGLRYSDRRAVVFLTSNEDEDLNAFDEFQQLPTNTDRKVRDRMDYWIGGGIHDDYFHGWPNDPEKKECFSFRWNEKRQRHRFYGFLHHPYLQTDPRFLLCVLLTHAIKNDWNTDPGELNKANTLRVDPCVLAAIKMVFSDEHNTWTN